MRMGFVSGPNEFKSLGIPGGRKAGCVCECGCPIGPKSWLCPHWSGPGLLVALGTVWKGDPSYGEPYVSP